MGLTGVGIVFLRAALFVRTSVLIPLSPFSQREKGENRISEELLIGLNDRNPQFHDLYRLNIATGELQLVQKNDEFAGFVTDDDYNVRFAARLTPNGGVGILKPDGKEGWELFIKIEMEDTLTTSPIGFGKTGRVLYMIDSRGRNTAALTALNLETGEQRVLAEDPHADISDIMIHPQRILSISIQ